MNYLKAALIKELCVFFEDDLKRIDHALDVLHYSELISQKIGNCDNEIIIASALFHDLGIKPAEAEYGYNDGKLQERLGPDEARKILQRIDFNSAKTDVVCDIISNHHSPIRFNYPELKVLRQADSIVNQLHRKL